MKNVFEKEATDMTREEWESVKNALNSLYSTVKLDCDGYELTLRLERLENMKLSITTYINGTFRLEWMDNNKPCEEQRRFLCKKTKRKKYYNDKLPEWKRLPKKVQKEIMESCTHEYVSYWPYWKSFSALKKHLIANNREIKLLSVS